MLPLLVLLAVSGRETIDLNAGWQFARVPAAPSIWNGPDAVPTQAWRVVGVSSEETAGENAAAKQAFDGDPSTFWHTEWSRRQAPYPHSITIDLGVPTEAVGLRLLPRQAGAQNGHPNRFRLFLDDQAVAEGQVPDSSGLFEIRFPRATGRTLRLEVLNGYRPEPFLVLAEIGLIRPTRQGNDWASQYSGAIVQTGDARFDPQPADLERLRRLEVKGIARWQPATLPHAAWSRPLNDRKIWQGVVYYRRHVELPTGRRNTLVLQGMQSVDVWLNGHYLAGRRGGYLPLRAEIRESGDLLVRVDNSDNPLIPPGKPQSQLDFMYGNGLVGNAAIISTDPLHIADPLEIEGSHGGGVEVRVRRIDAKGALLDLITYVQNSGRAERRYALRQTLFDAAGKVAASRTSNEMLPAGVGVPLGESLVVPHPHLWSPDSPYLYRLRTTLEADGRTIDQVETRIGVRTIEVSRERGFVLNGKPLRLIGTNRHQDYPWVGPALSDAAQRRDAMLIKRSGHNIVRLSHYDQSPAFMDACDELGVLTIPCVPGWQFINRDPRFTKRVIRDIKESVRRDRNHPCVAWWEASLNETYPPADLAKAWHDAARQEGATLTAGDDTPGAPWEILYNGWKEDLSRPSNPGKPGYIREYGDFEFGGGNSSSRVRIGAGIDALLNETWNHVWSYNKFRPQFPETMGAGTWEMFDHNVPWDFAVSASGLADLMRREKPSFWFYESQEAKRPYLRVAADWQPGAAKRRVVAFTNAARASLFVNGRLVGVGTAKPGGETAYDLRHAFDGSNTDHLAHPPIIFPAVSYSAGELKVVGSNGAVDTLRTAGAPARLKVWVDDLGVKPTTNDLVFVRAAVVDAKGTVCPSGSRTIRFAGVSFAGEDHAPSEMGVASVLVRTPVRAGKVQVTASAGSLHGRTELRFGG